MNEQGNLAKELLGLVYVCVCACRYLFCKCIFFLSLYCSFSPNSKTRFSFRPITLPDGTDSKSKKVWICKWVCLFLLALSRLDTFVSRLAATFSSEFVLLLLETWAGRQIIQMGFVLYVCTHTIVWCLISSCLCASVNDSFFTLAIHTNEI